MYNFEAIPLSFLRVSFALENERAFDSLISLSSRRFWGFDVSPLRFVAFLLLLYFMVFAVSPLVVAFPGEVHGAFQPRDAFHFSKLRITFVERLCAPVKNNADQSDAGAGNRIIVKKKRTLVSRAFDFKFYQVHVPNTASAAITDSLSQDPVYAFLKFDDPHGIAYSAAGFGALVSGLSPPLS